MFHRSTYQVFPQMSSGFEVCGVSLMQVITPCSAFGLRSRLLENKSSPCLSTVRYFINHITTADGISLHWQPCEGRKKTNVARKRVAFVGLLVYRLQIIYSSIRRVKWAKRNFGWVMEASCSWLWTAERSNSGVENTQVSCVLSLRAHLPAVFVVQLGLGLRTG